MKYVLYKSYSSNKIPLQTNLEILKRTSLTTTLISFVYLVQTSIPIPGVDQNGLKTCHYLLTSGQGVVDFRRCLSAHVFMLGISPFIISNIVISTSADFLENRKKSRSVLTKVPLIGHAINEFLVSKDEGKIGEVRIQ